MTEIGGMGSRVVTLIAAFYIIGACIVSVIGVGADNQLAVTEEQLQSLNEFKKMVMPRMENELEYMKTDFYLIRWLRANNFNLKAADSMLMRNLNWRKQWKIDGVHNEDWSDMYQDFPATNNTHDMEGRPIGTISFQDWDLRRALTSGRQVRLFRYLMKLIDEGTEEVFRLQREGKNVTQWKLLINMEGFNLIKHGCASCLAGAPFLINSFEDYYPHFANEIITVNTPAAFQVVINLAKPILSQHNRNALKVFGFNRAQWMEYLDKQIARDQRYPEFGGTKKRE